MATGEGGGLQPFRRMPPCLEPVRRSAGCSASGSSRAAPAGYAGLLGWLGGFGTVCLVGIEGTGSYGAGLTRHVTAAGVRVVEVDRSDRQDRRRQGKSDRLVCDRSVAVLCCCTGLWNYRIRVSIS